MFQSKFPYAIKVKTNSADIYVRSGRCEIDCNEGIIRTNILPAFLAVEHFEHWSIHCSLLFLSLRRESRLAHFANGSPKQVVQPMHFDISKTWRAEIDPSRGPPPLRVHTQLTRIETT
jgi:hypothetical protein